MIRVSGNVLPLLETLGEKYPVICLIHPINKITEKFTKNIQVSIPNHENLNSSIEINYCAKLKIV